MRDWHGWSVGDSSLCIGRLPMRKSVAIYAVHGGRVKVLGYFRSEAAAREALVLLERIALARSNA